MPSDSEAQTWKILIIDDDTDNLGVASQYLEFLGAEVRAAQDGESGLAILATYKPTFILLDLSMPVMDGWETLKRIRADDGPVAIPVIALTAHAMQDDRALALAAGFDGYITKPFLLGTLVADIKACLAKAKRNAEGAS